MTDFDEPNLLIGDGGDIVQTSEHNSLVYDFQVILGMIPSERKQWCRSWLNLYGLELPEYIRILADLPDFLITKPPLTSEDRWVFAQVQQLYKALSTWLDWITKPDRPKPAELNQPPLAKYEPFAWLSKSILDLVTAIHGHEPQPNFVHPLFHSPAHLWFWCQVAFCRFHLKRMAKTPHTDIQGKKEVLTDWSDQLRLLEDCKEAFKTKRTRSKDLIHFLERLYPDVIQWEALQLAEADSDFEYGPWADFLRVQHYTRNETKNGEYAKNLQILYLYFFPDSPAITRLHVTGLHQKLPKPPKSSKPPKPEGFRFEQKGRKNIKKCK